MSVTKIIFKHGATEPTGSNFATVGEPLWHQDTENNSDLGHLYVTNGTNNPTLIGPIEATQYVHPTVTVVAGDEHITVNDSDAGTTGIIIDAAAGYAIGGIIVNNTGHITAVKSVELPASSSVQIGYTPTITSSSQYAYKIGELTDGTNTWEIYGKDQVGSAGSGRDDELTAANQNPADGTVILKTAQGSRKVTLLHEAQNNNGGTYASFTVTDDGNDGDKFVTMNITVIDGGTW